MFIRTFILSSILLFLMLLTLLIQLQGFKQRGYLHVQDVQNNFKGGIMKIYINLFIQTTRFFYHQIIGLEIAKRINLMEKLKIEVLHWLWVQLIGLRSMKMLNRKLGRIFYQGYSIQEPKQVVVNMPNEMKRKSIFYELHYWKVLYPQQPPL